MKNVYVGVSENSAMATRVEPEIAKKMLEVYDKMKPFESRKIDISTTVSVAGSLIEIKIAGAFYFYSLSESLRLREALLAAEEYVEARQ